MISQPLTGLLNFTSEPCFKAKPWKQQLLEHGRIAKSTLTIIHEQHHKYLKSSNTLTTIHQQHPFDDNTKEDQWFLAQKMNDGFTKKCLNPKLLPRTHQLPHHLYFGKVPP